MSVPAHRRHDIFDNVWEKLEPHLPGRKGSWGGIARFKILLDKHYPAWRKARAQLTRYTLGRTRQCYK